MDFAEVDTAIGPVLALPDFAVKWKESLESCTVMKKERIGKERKERISGR